MTELTKGPCVLCMREGLQRTLTRDGVAIKTIVLCTSCLFKGG